LSIRAVHHDVPPYGLSAGIREQHTAHEFAKAKTAEQKIVAATISK
jgi:hypothetical protein